MKPKLHLVTSVADSLAVLLNGQPRFLARDFDVTLVTSPGPMVERLRDQEGLPVVTLPMQRQITPRSDARSLAALTRHFRRHRPDLVQSYTPKAGLLAMMAARAARVPHRVHGVVGMPLMEATGNRRRILAVTERLTYACATDLTCNSFGLRDWMTEHLTSRPITVVHHGSINGIRVEDYGGAVLGPLREPTRARLGIAPDEVTWLFVGRIVGDKGVVELVDAFERLRAGHPRALLVLVGPFEHELDPVPDRTRKLLEGHEAITLTGFVSDVRPYLAAADVFVLPSYREGLPNGLLEAAAAGPPAVATDINGCNEVVEREHTGLLVPPKQVGPLQTAMERLTADADLRRAMGASARESVERRYEQRRFWEALAAFYRALLEGGPRGQTRSR